MVQKGLPVALAAALTGVEAGGSHVGAGVDKQAQRFEPAGILGDRAAEVGWACYETKPGSAARARQVAQAPAHAMRISSTPQRGLKVVWPGLAQMVCP